MTDQPITYEAVIVGAGPAGLSAALTLGRARRATLLIDGGLGRNAPSGGVHNFLSRDGIAPAICTRSRWSSCTPTLRSRSGLAWPSV
jgi:thioredoxin reductase